MLFLAPTVELRKDPVMKLHSLSQLNISLYLYLECNHHHKQWEMELQGWEMKIFIKIVPQTTSGKNTMRELGVTQHPT